MPEVVADLQVVNVSSIVIATNMNAMAGHHCYCLEDKRDRIHHDLADTAPDFDDGKIQVTSLSFNIGPFRSVGIGGGTDTHG